MEDHRPASDYEQDEYALEGEFTETVKIWSGLEVDPELMGYNPYLEIDWPPRF